MIHKSFILVVLLFLGQSATSVCQPIEGSFIINYGSFNMSDLKGFQDEIRTQTPVPVKEISSFPSYPGFAGKYLPMLEISDLGWWVASIHRAAGLV